MKSICFVDWQAGRCCSPVLDLTYAIFSSTDKSFRDQHYETLLNTYYSSLCATVRKLGSDPDKLFAFNDFQQQLREFGEYPLLFGTIAIAVRVAKADSIENLDDFAERIERGENADLVKSFDNDSEVEFSRLINGK